MVMLFPQSEAGGCGGMDSLSVFNCEEERHLAIGHFSMRELLAAMEEAFVSQIDEKVILRMLLSYNREILMELVPGAVKHCR